MSIENVSAHAGSLTARAMARTFVGGSEVAQYYLSITDQLTEISIATSGVLDDGSIFLRFISPVDGAETEFTYANSTWAESAP